MLFLNNITKYEDLACADVNLNILYNISRIIPRDFIRGEQREWDWIIPKIQIKRNLIVQEQECTVVRDPIS